MQIVNGQVLDQLTQHADKLIGASDVDDSLDDLAVINLLIIRIIVHMKQLIDHISKIRRQLLSHLGAGILGRHLFT